MPKQRPNSVKYWQKVSDTTGRGYGHASKPKTPGTVSNVKAREQLPRPTMATITTQNPSSLDHSNRFYDDNRRKLEEMVAYGEPEYT